MLCYYFLLISYIRKNIRSISMVYINECIGVNTALKNSFKSMSCLRIIQQFPRNFPRWQAPGSFKSMAWSFEKGKWQQKRFWRQFHKKRKKISSNSNATLPNDIMAAWHNVYRPLIYRHFVYIHIFCSS